MNLALYLKIILDLQYSQNKSMGGKRMRKKFEATFLVESGCEFLVHAHAAHRLVLGINPKSHRTVHCTVQLQISCSCSLRKKN